MRADASSATATFAAHILLVEDEPVVRAAMSYALQGAGYDVTAVDRPSAAIDAFASPSHFDLVITDMMLPEMTGSELIAILRQRAADLRAIIVSGYSPEFAEAQARLPANVVYLGKDAAPRHLVPTIKAVLGETPAQGKGAPQSGPGAPWKQSAQVIADPTRRVLIGGRLWTVYERMLPYASQVPRSLVFETDRHARRVRNYPMDWHVLDDAALAALVDRR
ncbi:MAG TPA: response regulator [Gemmatimonadaceae bacterium]|jgi:two-component system cell cycle response regulator CpdR|nr:response regulator [Gemmatimonadaceae bacterium]